MNESSWILRCRVGPLLVAADNFIFSYQFRHMVFWVSWKMTRGIWKALVIAELLSMRSFCMLEWKIFRICYICANELLCMSYLSCQCSFLHTDAKSHHNFF